MFTEHFLCAKYVCANSGGTKSEQHRHSPTLNQFKVPVRETDRYVAQYNIVMLYGMTVEDRVWHFGPEGSPGGLPVGSGD